MIGFRKCNICGKENALNKWMCDCGNIITGLPIIYEDDPTENNDGICEFCGEYFDENEVECPFCFKKRSSVKKRENFYFICNKGDKQMIPYGSSELGRSGFMGKILNDANAFAVSERHLIIHNEDNELSFVDVSRNGTFVNGKKIVPNQKFVPQVNDEISLGGVPSLGDKYAFTIILGKE